MSEKWVVMPRQKDLDRNGMYYKHLDLVTPERA